MKKEYKIIMLLILVISLVALVLTSSYALFLLDLSRKVFLQSGRSDMGISKRSCKGQYLYIGFLSGFKVN